MSESQLAAALVKVQASLPQIAKSHTAKVPTKNGGEYSYKYADLADVTEAIMPLLASNGLAWVALPTLDEQGRFVLAYSLKHVSGECESGSFPLGDAGQMQALGSAITYARRYSLCSVVGVVPDEDDDGRAASQRPKQSKPRPTANPPADPADAPATGTTPLQALWAYANGQLGWSQQKIEEEFARWAHGEKFTPQTPPEQIQAFLLDLRSEAAA